MPLARYFLYVSGVLLALIFIVDSCLPKLPTAERADSHLPTIRIHSDQKWPERVVYDTSIPTIIPAAPANALANIPAAETVTERPAKAREAFAQCNDPMQTSQNRSCSGNAKLQGDISHRPCASWRGNRNLAGSAWDFGDQNGFADCPFGSGAASASAPRPARPAAMAPPPKA
jgi:hypothetical protein